MSSTDSNDLPLDAPLSYHPPSFLLYQVLHLNLPPQLPPFTPLSATSKEKILHLPQKHPLMLKLLCDLGIQHHLFQFLPPHHLLLPPLDPECHPC